MSIFFSIQFKCLELDQVFEIAKSTPAFKSELTPFISDLQFYIHLAPKQALLDYAIK